MDKMYKLESVAHLKRHNRADSARPLIGMTFDWRKNAATGESVYFEKFANQYHRAVQNAGGEVFVLSFDDRVEDFQHLIDGYLIPGGRDIHPRFYGAELNGSVLGDQPEAHFGFHKAAYEGLPKSCPLMGICWGFQFINVINGGTMVQDLPDKANHYRKRRMTVKQDSWLGKTMGTQVFGSCHHHQALDKLASNVEAVAYDDASNLVHAIELKDPERFVVGTLWHPEITFRNECELDFEDTAFRLMSAFVEKCREYKKAKAAGNEKVASS